MWKLASPKLDGKRAQPSEKVGELCVWHLLTLAHGPDWAAFNSYGLAAACRNRSQSLALAAGFNLC